MTEAVCYALIWVAYTLLLYLHVLDVGAHGTGRPPPPPAPPPVAGAS